MFGLQIYHDDIEETFATFPPGELLDNAAEMTAMFEEYLTTLVNLTESKSKILSWGSTKIVKVLSTVRLPENTAEGVIDEFLRVLPRLMNTYRGISSGLTRILGDVTHAVNEAMTDLEIAFTDYTLDFLDGNDNGVRVKVDYEPVTARVQTLTNTISRIGESIMNEPQLATPATQDAVTVLTLVLGHIMICFHGLSGCSQAMLIEQELEPPVAVGVCFQGLGDFAYGMTGSIVNLRNPNANSATRLVSKLVAQTKNLNALLKNRLGMIDNVCATVGQISQSLLTSVTGTGLSDDNTFQV